MRSRVQGSGFRVSGKSQGFRKVYVSGLVFPKLWRVRLRFWEVRLWGEGLGLERLQG